MSEQHNSGYANKPTPKKRKRDASFGILNDSIWEPNQKRHR